MAHGEQCKQLEADIKLTFSVGHIIPCRDSTLLADKEDWDEEGSTWSLPGRNTTDHGCQVATRCHEQRLAGKVEGRPIEGVGC